MKQDQEFINLLKAIKDGDTESIEKLITILVERLIPNTTRYLQKFPKVIKRVDVTAFCEVAVKKILKKYPPQKSPEWSLAKLLIYFHNELDDLIANTLTELAQQGDKEAEEQLFKFIYKKLLEQFKD